MFGGLIQGRFSTILSMEVVSFELGVFLFGCVKSTAIGFGGPSFGGVEDFVVGWALDFSTQKRALEICMIFWMTFVTFAKKNLLSQLTLKLLGITRLEGTITLIFQFPIYLEPGV